MNLVSVRKGGHNLNQVLRQIQKTLSGELKEAAADDRPCKYAWIFLISFCSIIGMTPGEASWAVGGNYNPPLWIS